MASNIFILPSKNLKQDPSIDEYNESQENLLDSSCPISSFDDIENDGHAKRVGHSHNISNRNSDNRDEVNTYDAFDINGGENEGENLDCTDGNLSNLDNLEYSEQIEFNGTEENEISYDENFPYDNTRHEDKSLATMSAAANSSVNNFNGINNQVQHNALKGVYDQLEKNYKRLKNDCQRFESSFDIEINRMREMQSKFNNLRKQVEIQQQLIELVIKHKQIYLNANINPPGYHQNQPTNQNRFKPLAQSHSCANIGHCSLNGNQNINNSIEITPSSKRPRLEPSQNSTVSYGYNISSRILLKENIRFEAPLTDDNVNVFFSNELRHLDVNHFHLKHRGSLLKSKPRGVKTLTYECSKRRNLKCEVKVYVHYNNETLTADMFRSANDHNH